MLKVIKHSDVVCHFWKKLVSPEQKANITQSNGQIYISNNNSEVNPDLLTQSTVLSAKYQIYEEIFGQKTGFQVWPKFIRKSRQFKHNSEADKSLK